MTLPTPRLLIAAAVLLASLFNSGSVVAAGSAPAHITVPDAADGSRLGSAVSIDHDTLVIGAPDDDAAGPFAGSVFVYTRSGTSWKKQSTLLGPKTTGYRSFGESVSISRNVIVIGAPFDGPNGNTRGAAYVYIRTGNKWSLQATLTPSDAADNQQFGTAVAIDDNVIVVGAFLDSTVQTNAGAAYVFVRSGNAWVQRAKLRASNASAYAFFGSSVAVSGANIVVGSPTSETAYVFSANKTSWSQQALLTASDALEGDYSAFGASVAIDHDTVVVGAPEEGMYAIEAGAAYTFALKGHTWVQQKKLTAPDAKEEDEFGTAVSVLGKVIAVGAPYSGSHNEGAVYVFGSKPKDEVVKHKLTSSTNSAFLGASVALAGDVVAAGAPAFDTFSPSPAGAAFVFPTR
jgi:hypothetical protein